MSASIAELLHKAPLEPLDAEILLAEVLGVNRSYLYTWPEKLLPATTCHHFQQHVQRRLQGEPIAYIIGRKAFWTFELDVTPATLIPRPETELLVEQALARIPPHQTHSIIDLGTGSGAVALSIASERPHCQVIATDISKHAIQVAANNAKRLQLPNVQFVVGHWLAPFQPASFDVIVSNPPYIAIDDPHLHQLTYEPQHALVAGKMGLDDIEILVANAKHYLKTGGWLLLEHGYEQATTIQQLFHQANYTHITTYHDLANLPRVTVGAVSLPFS